MIIYSTARETITEPEKPSLRPTVVRFRRWPKILILSDPYCQQLETISQQFKHGGIRFTKSQRIICIDPRTIASIRTLVASVLPLLSHSEYTLTGRHRRTNGQTIGRTPDRCFTFSAMESTSVIVETAIVSSGVSFPANRPIGTVFIARELYIWALPAFA